MRRIEWIILRTPENCDGWWVDSFGTVFQTVSVKNWLAKFVMAPLERTAQLRVFATRETKLMNKSGEHPEGQ
jgi:hypothetical protein